MINAVMNMNEVIIQDINLSFNIEKFSKKFAKMCVVFLIDFFFRIRSNDIDRKVLRFDCLHDFFELALNNSIFAKCNQFDNTVC